jgi:hypothetical protein
MLQPFVRSLVPFESQYQVPIWRTGER